MQLAHGFCRGDRITIAAAAGSEFSQFQDLQIQRQLALSETHLVSFSPTIPGFRMHKRRLSVPSESHSMRSQWMAELRATMRLAWPLVTAQLAQMSLNTTDIVMMGWLGPDFLAAGSLTTSLLFPLLVFGIGTLTVVASLVAQAIGARDSRGVRRSVRQGLWVAAALSVIMVPLALQTGTFLRLFGQAPDIVALAETYAVAFAWAFPPALAFVVLRGFVSAQGSTSIVLWVTLAGVVANAALNYLLMFGHWGFPRLELTGAAIATVAVDTIMLALLYGYIQRHRRYRRYAILLRLWRPDWARLRDVVRLGLPVGFMLLAETGLFAVAALMMGWLGKAELAAHAIALQCAALAFMVPLGMSQATTIRVGLAFGRGSGAGVGVAGWTSLGLGTAFMMITSVVFLVFPENLVALFIDTTDPQNARTLRFAAAYLGIAALFQLVDSGQVIAAAALRGINDTRIPLFLGLAGYWAVGVPVAYGLGFGLGYDGVGIWFGLASGLAFVAIVLTARFAMRAQTNGTA